MQANMVRITVTLFFLGCLSLPLASVGAESNDDEYRYEIAVGDNLTVFVWRNPELSMSVPVRPDGRISLPLIDELKALGETPERLAQIIETKLAKYIKQPTVSVIVMSFGVNYDRSIKVIGGNLKPMSIPFIEDLYLLDVMVELGGLQVQSAGARAKILRRSAEGLEEIEVDLEALLKDGAMSHNALMRPSDILLIPERWF